jgi:pimeloyl-ACP methyl ester carboxylesterase
MSVPNRPSPTCCAASARGTTRQETLEQRPVDASDAADVWVPMMRFDMVACALTLVLAASGCAGQSATKAAAPTGEQSVGTIAMQSKVTGSGTPLVLVGGGLTGWLSWDAHAERLAATHKVVRLQPLNVQWGLENRALPADYSVKTEGRAIAAALDEVGLTGAVDIVGWSYGGLATIDFALDHPDRIRTLTLIEPPALWVLHAQGPMDDEAQKSEASLRTLDGEISEAQLEEFLAVAGFARPGTSVRDLPQWPVWNRHRQSLRNSLAVVGHKDDLARLSAFAKPVLLVKGSGSSRFLHQATDAMAARFPRARVVEMPAGHAPQIVSMDRFLEVLAIFLANA